MVEAVAEAVLPDHRVVGAAEGRHAEVTREDERVSRWEDRMAEKQHGKADREVEIQRRAYLGEVFLKHYPPSASPLFEPQVEIIPEIIAANCLGITYGDPGPKLPPEVCRECWGERHVWLGNVWGMEHAGGTMDGCQHDCHGGEVWLA